MMRTGAATCRSPSSPAIVQTQPEANRSAAAAFHGCHTRAPARRAASSRSKSRCSVPAPCPSLPSYPPMVIGAREAYPSRRARRASPRSGGL